MLKLAIIAFGLVVLLGCGLAIQVMRAPGKAPSRLLASLHGVVALGSYGVLLAALMGPPHGVATGTQSFGLVAALLLLLAMVLGILALALHLIRKRMPGTAIGVHASVAIVGYVILAVYWLV